MSVIDPRIIPSLVGTLSIVVIGFINPTILQDTDSEGKRSGYPSFLALAAVSFLVTLIVMYFTISHRN
jgi:hypothetical protein